jgi:hypothetical protein
MSEQSRQSTGTATAPVGVAFVDVWTFSVKPALDIDLTGFSVEATDGHIGKVDEATYDAGGSYLIIDTGPWIFGKKVMVPAGVVKRIDTDSEAVFVDRNKDEIKSAPEFDEKTARDDDEYRGRLGRYYGKR